MSRRIIRLAVAAVLGVGPLACGDREAVDRTGGESPGEWALASEPSLDIGVVSGEEPYQLHDVRDVVRLNDGGIAVAHQGTHQVRLYEADGTFRLAAGEEGDGPGQWRALAELERLGGDSLLVVDHRLLRHGLLDVSTGAFLGVADEGRVQEILPNRWHRRGLLLEAPAGVDRVEVFDAVLGALDVSSPDAPGFARLDPSGRVWVLGVPSAPVSALRIFDLDGEERARIPLPSRFRPFTVGEDELLGVWRDSVDVEHVRAYPLQGPADWTGRSVPSALSASPSDAPPAETPELPELSAAFRMVAVAQEFHYAGNSSYTAEVARLQEARAFELPEGARLDLFDASPTGWRGRIVDTATGAGCTIFYGSYASVEGITPGAFSCWALE